MVARAEDTSLFLLRKQARCVPFLSRAPVVQASTHMGSCRNRGRGGVTAVAAPLGGWLDGAWETQTRGRGEVPTRGSGNARDSGDELPETRGGGEGRQEAAGDASEGAPAGSLDWFTAQFVSEEGTEPDDDQRSRLAEIVTQRTAAERDEIEGIIAAVEDRALRRMLGRIEASRPTGAAASGEGVVLVDPATAAAEVGDNVVSATAEGSDEVASASDAGSGPDSVRAEYYYYGSPEHIRQLVADGGGSDAESAGADDHAVPSGSSTSSAGGVEYFHHEAPVAAPPTGEGPLLGLGPPGRTPAAAWLEAGVGLGPPGHTPAAAWLEAGVYLPEDAPPGSSEQPSERGASAYFEPVPEFGSGRQYRWPGGAHAELEDILSYLQVTGRPSPEASASEVPTRGGGNARDSGDEIPETRGGGEGRPIAVSS